VVPAQPADTFADRLVEYAASSRRGGSGPQVVYVSQITFLQVSKHCLQEALFKPVIEHVQGAM
jgi:hypothetical protein